MLNIKTLTVNPLQENTYIVSDETQEAVIIDCGALYAEERMAVVNYIRDNYLKPQRLLCTHAHLDHCFGINTIYEEFGLKPEVAASDDFLMENQQGQASQMFGMTLPYDIPPIAPYLKADDTIAFGSHVLTIIPTPGHTPGSVFFYCKEEDVAFSGDTLFRMSVGRTDFERGSYQQLMESLQRIATLPPQTRVYCGHGPATTIGDELQYNLYLR